MFKKPIAFLAGLIGYQLVEKGWQPAPVEIEKRVEVEVDSGPKDFEFTLLEKVERVYGAIPKTHPHKARIGQLLALIMGEYDRFWSRGTPGLIPDTEPGKQVGGFARVGVVLVQLFPGQTPTLAYFEQIMRVNLKNFRELPAERLPKLEDFATTWDDWESLKTDSGYSDDELAF
jgi:hypothetical protein